MTTKLTKPVTRETTQRYRTKAVVVTLSPATAPDLERCIPGLPERIELHLKGTQQRLRLPLEELLRIAIRRGEL